MSIGIKEELTTTLEDITRIPTRVLNDREVLKRCDTFPREDDANGRWSVFTAGLVRHERVDAVWRGLERFPVAPAGDHPGIQRSQVVAWNRKAWQLGMYGSVLADRHPTQTVERPRIGRAHV